MASSTFKKDYEKYKSKHLTVTQLDFYMSCIMMESSGTWGSIMAAIKLVVFGAYYWTRCKLVDVQMEIDKQEFEQTLAHEHDNDNEIIT